MTAPAFGRRPRGLCPVCCTSYNLDGRGRLQPHPEKLPPGTVVKPALCDGGGDFPGAAR